MQLGKYEILEELGQGGFGVVYKAHDTVLDVVRAVKVLHPALVADTTFLQRFKQEARLAARLEHPNLVPVYDFAEAEGRFFLAMKYMPGKSLKDLLSLKGKLEQVQALELFSQVCEGVAYAHQQGVVHRDLKPGNILIDADGSVRVSDMGFAKAIAGSASVSMSATGAMIGTPPYMAPEIWRGKPATPASDQYSLACILYEMLTGEVLFDGETTPAVMLKHFEPLDFPISITGELLHTFEKVLDKIPEKRFMDVNSFKNELLNYSLSDHLSLSSINNYQVKLETLTETKTKKSVYNSTTSLNLKRNPARMEWVEILNGEFMYGESKKPLFLPTYLIAKYPVTNAQYKLFLDANPNYPLPKGWGHKAESFPEGKRNHPVVNVSYHDALAFCAWAGCRLPSEEEWEKAARGTDGRKYPWGDQWEDSSYCNSRESGKQGTTPVDAYPLGISPYGVWDMLGNVWEWTSKEKGKYQVLCGGSWVSSKEDTRATRRYYYYSNNSDDNYGFRCVTEYPTGAASP